MDRIIPAAIACGIAALAFLVLVFSTYFTVDQGERAVITHYGRVMGEADPGFHLKMPFVTGVTTVNLRVQKLGYEQAGQTDNRMTAYSRDQQPASVALGVNWHVTNPTELYSRYGAEENFEANVLDSKAREIFKNVFGQFDAADAIQKRAVLNAQVTDALQTALKGQPVIIDSVQVENIDFSTQYEQAVEARMQAIVKQQQAEADKAKRIIDADAAKYEREAQADAEKYAGLAEATAIEAKNNALRNSPDIVAYTAAQRWNGKLPDTMVPGGALPMLNLK